MVQGSKRVKVLIYERQTIEDGYGGGAENLVLVDTQHATIQTVQDSLKTQNDSTWSELAYWLKATRRIDNISNKLAVINDEKFNIVITVKNRRRYFYRLERVKGGDSGAN